MTQTSIKIRIKSPQSQDWESETGPDLWVTPTREVPQRRGGDRQLRTVAIVAIVGVLALTLIGVAYIGLGGRSPRPVAAVDDTGSNPETAGGAQSTLELIDRSTHPDTGAQPRAIGTPGPEGPAESAQVMGRPEASEPTAADRQGPAIEQPGTSDTVLAQGPGSALSVAETTTAEPASAQADLAQTDAPPAEAAPESQPVPETAQAPVTASVPSPSPEVEAAPLATTPEAPPARAPAPRGPVARAQFTSGISGREPIDRLGTRIPAPRDQAISLYYFTDIRGMAGHTVTHRWIYEGQTMAQVRFKIGGRRWRVYSSKVLPPQMTGRWEVVTTDEDGRVLKTDEFVFDPDADGVS